MLFYNRQSMWNRIQIGTSPNMFLYNQYKQRNTLLCNIRYIHHCIQTHILLYKMKYMKSYHNYLNKTCCIRLYTLPCKLYYTLFCILPYTKMNSWIPYKMLYL